jgi:D-alanyl-D-alanine-carboxypeptidase/D-alanyl-D-alanine-endopeptidase
MRLLPICICAFVLLALFADVNAQTPILDTMVDHAAADFVKDGPWIGLSVAVVQDNKVRIHSYGTTRTDQTLYEIGSISKTFASLLLARAVEEKKVKLDDDIRLYLKGDYPNLQYNGNPIRLLHMVNLTSSLPNNLPDWSGLVGKVNPDSLPFEIVKLNQHYTQDDFFRDLHNVKLDTVPGLVPRHSNTAGALLALLLENIYHKPYDQLLSELLTGTLNMKHTYLNLPLDKAGLLAKCYNDKGMPQPYIVANQSAAWSVKSTIGDMANYMAYQLDESNAAVKLTHQAAWGDPANFALGFNWFLGSFEGQRIVHNDGTTFGFTTYCLLYPDLHFAVVMMTNECVFNSSIQNKLNAMGSGIFEKTFFTAAQRSSPAFGYSPAVHALVAEMDKRGWDHAAECAAGIQLDGNEVNNWAYALLRRGEKQKALVIFKLNTTLHPKSWNAYDSEAEGFEDTGDIASAITCYKRSLELNPNNTNAVDHLKKLQK